MTYDGGRTFSTQKTMFDEIVWNIKKDYYLDASNSHNERGAPVGVKASGNLRGVEKTRPPYWEFDWSVYNVSGLSLSNIKVRGTQSKSSTELVFESLKFTDLEIIFDDKSRMPFDIDAALNNTWPILDGSLSSLMTVENGSWSPTAKSLDKLYQRGIRLRLVTNVLGASDERCDVTLDMTVVFRGAANDFDPGGMPVAMLMWPQLSWKWNNNKASKRVKGFRGSVVLVTQVTMYRMNHGNVSSLFTDSNTSAESLKRSSLYGVRATGGYVMNLPFGWGMTFDYVTPNITKEREITGVYGPNDGNKYSGASPRRRTYTNHNNLPIMKRIHAIEVDKKPRQGDFDNIHTHAKMEESDICRNVQVHAPFCGHSCVHLHWRWSNVASSGAVNGRGWQYKGWSSTTTRSKSRAFDTIDAPLIPPNQRLDFAILAPGSVRHSHSNIVNPLSPKLLPVDRKKYWYTVDIIDPPANQNQVIFEHGIGWAYRYATPDESSSVEDLIGAISDSLPWSGTPTQSQLAQFFATDVYPTWRYIKTFPYVHCDSPQVPAGDYKDVHSGGRDIPMEDL